MVWYFIGVYVINRTSHGHLEIRNFSPCVEEISAQPFNILCIFSLFQKAYSWLFKCSLSQGSKKKTCIQACTFCKQLSHIACRGRSLLIFNYLLEDDLPVPLPTGQVCLKSYLPSKKLYLFWTARHDFFQALLRVFIIHRRSENSLFTTQNSLTNVQ